MQDGHVFFSKCLEKVIYLEHLNGIVQVEWRDVMNDLAHRHQQKIMDFSSHSTVIILNYANDQPQGISWILVVFQHGGHQCDQIEQQINGALSVKRAPKVLDALNELCDLG